MTTIHQDLATVRANMADEATEEHYAALDRIAAAVNGADEWKEVAAEWQKNAQVAEARLRQLNTKLAYLHRYAADAVQILQSRPYPTHQLDTWGPLQKLLEEVSAASTSSTPQDEPTGPHPIQDQTADFPDLPKADL